MKKSFLNHEQFILCKISTLILLWTFSTGLLYNLSMKPYSFLQVSALYEVPVVAMVISSVFLLSPLAGFMADVKFGRFESSALW